MDLDAKLTEFQHYYNCHRGHAGLEGDLQNQVLTADFAHRFPILPVAKTLSGLYQTPIAA